MKLTLTVLNDVIKLANERKESYGHFNDIHNPNGLTSMQDSSLYSNTPEYQKYERDNKALLKYLKQLDFDAIKELQVLMYLGRDDEFNEEPNGLKRFELLKKSFDNQGWNDCEIEVHQIDEKLPLGDYLQAGKNIIGW